MTRPPHEYLGRARTLHEYGPRAGTRPPRVNLSLTPDPAARGIAEGIDHADLMARQAALEDRRHRACTGLRSRQRAPEGAPLAYILIGALVTLALVLLWALA